MVLFQGYIFSLIRQKERMVVMGGSECTQETGAHVPQEHSPEGPSERSWCSVHSRV